MKAILMLAIRALITFGLMWLWLFSGSSYAQVDFFDSSQALSIEIQTSFRSLLKAPQDAKYQPAHIRITFADSSSYEGEVSVKPRGNFRRNYCGFPPLKLRIDSGAIAHPLFTEGMKVKMVGMCKNSKSFQEMVLVEELVYQAFQEVSPRAFRVRRAQATFVDSDDRKRPIQQILFFIEPVKTLASRLDCREIEPVWINGDMVDRKSYLNMAFFHYMIGNTDWHLNNLHNLKLIRPNDPRSESVYTVPYDFDYSGIVNAPYAIPHEKLGIPDVTHRLYTGYCPTGQELTELVTVYQDAMPEIKSLFEAESTLRNPYQRHIQGYLSEFEEMLAEPAFLMKTIQRSCIQASSATRN